MERLRKGGAAVPRAALGIAWRSGRTILLHAALALAAFLLAALLTERSDPPGWATALLPLYVLAGTLVGGYVGVLTALSRETQTIVTTLAGRLGALSRRALDCLALPAGGIEPARLRRATEARLPESAGGRAARAAANFGIARAVDAVGLTVLRERLIALADNAERRGTPVLARDAIEAVAREGVGVAVASRLALGWAATRVVALILALVLLVSLPLAALLLD